MISPLTHPLVAQAQLVDRAKKTLAEINQIFVDVDSWNQNVRKPHEEIIDPDPHGELQAARGWLERFLEQN